MYHVFLQAMRAQPAERPTAEQMHRHAWRREPLVITPVARLASAEEADAGALCVAQLAATLRASDRRLCAARPRARRPSTSWSQKTAV